MPDQRSERGETPIAIESPSVTEDELDDLQQLVEERDACFAVSYLLLKHLLLSVMFLMAVFTLVRLTLKDSPVKRDTRSEPLSPDALDVSSNTVTVNVTISERAILQQETVAINRSLELPLIKANSGGFRFTVLMARVSGIIAICFGILGIFTDSVTLVLLFVLHTSFRLVTTFFIAAFHQTLESMVVLFIINILSFIFVTLMIIRSWQICLVPNRQRVDSSKKLADKFESAIEVRITIPQDDLTGDKKDAIINALNRRVSKATSVSSFTLSQLNDAFVSLDDEVNQFTLVPPSPLHRASFNLASGRSSQCLPPTMAKTLAASLAHAHPLQAKES